MTQQLQHEQLPEAVLNELELFLFGLAEADSLDDAKKLRAGQLDFFEFFLACELGMTVSRLRTELTDAELVYFAAFYELKADRENKEMNRASGTAVACRHCWAGMARSSVELIVDASKAINPLKRVKAETKKLESATKNVNDRLRDSKRRFAGAGNAATKASKGVKSLNGAVGKLLGLFASIQAAKFVFFKTAELETQTRSLQVLTGSLGDAQKIIKELQAFGAVTPFTSSELIETAKRLKAFGFETEKVVDVTKRLGDIAGATGADLKAVLPQRLVRFRPKAVCRVKSFCSCRSVALICKARFARNMV